MPITVIAGYHWAQTVKHHLMYICCASPFEGMIDTKITRYQIAFNCSKICIENRRLLCNFMGISYNYWILILLLEQSEIHQRVWDVINSLTDWYSYILSNQTLHKCSKGPTCMHIGITLWGICMVLPHQSASIYIGWERKGDTGRGREKTVTDHHAWGW